MKKAALFLLLVFFTPALKAVDFSSLLREKPLVLSFVADKNCNASFLLNVKSLKESRLDIFLKVTYIVQKDTLNDYLYLDESYSGMIKEIYLEQGDSVRAYLALNNSETDKIDYLKGSFTIKTAPAIDMQSTGEVCRFTGSIWKEDQLPLFRIAKNDDKNQMLNIDFTLTENFEFDRLYLKIKVVSPAQGILLYSKEVIVNEGETLSYRRKMLKIDFPDLEVQKQGSYYVQVFHQMAQDRVNGVESITYRLSDK